MSLRKLPREAAKRLELLRNTNQYNLEREMYEVYTDMLRRNEEIGMSDLDLQGPTSFHTRMDTIRPKVSQCEKLDVNAGLSMFDNQGTVGIRMSTRFRKVFRKPFHSVVEQECFFHQKEDKMVKRQTCIAVL